MSASNATISPEFCDADADITFTSHDNVEFKIHSKNLECGAGNFLPMSGTLPEDSSTLRLLFSYIYPRRQPELEDFGLDALLLLGDAAEKYQVFSAMSICRIRIKEHKSHNASRVLLYGYRHGYRDLLNAGANELEQYNLELALQLLPSELALRWAVYCEKVRQNLLQIILDVTATSPSTGASAQQDDAQPTRVNDTHVVEMLRLFSKENPTMTSRWSLPSLLSRALINNGVTGRDLNDACGRFASRLYVKLLRIPHFDTFVTFPQP